MKTLKLDLALALPRDAAACDDCVQRIIDMLRGRAGISRVHVDLDTPTEPKLCLHFDPALARIENVRAWVEEAGAELLRKFDHLSVDVGGLRHERQARLVEAALGRVPGVLSASVAFGTGHLYVEFDPVRMSRAALLAEVASNGLAPAATVAPHDHDDDHDHDHGAKGEKEHDHAHGGPFGERSELIFSLACGALTVLGWGLGRAGLTSVVPTALYVVAYVLGSWFTVQEIAVALRGRRFEIDFLMLVAAVGAALLGEWFEGALLLFLFTLGHALEGFAMSRARNAIAALAKLVPATAIRLDASGAELEVPVEKLEVGDRVLLKPHTRIAADGFVVDGTSSVDQAPITGESVPVDKRAVSDPVAAAAAVATLPAEHRVFAGTINGSSALTIAVTKPAADSTLARVVKMVAEAQTQKSPTQQFTDRFERVFVPVILGVVVLLHFAWVVLDEPFSASFYRAMAVLVAASPCALAIATPSAVLAGIARAARGGVLVKGGAHLESLGLVRAIAFDKTGTLTEGKPQLTDVAPAAGVSPDDLLRVAEALERRSDHPLAGAIVRGAAERTPADTARLEAANVEAIIGFGVQGDVAGQRVRIGKPGLFTHDAPLPRESAKLVDGLQSQGRTVMVVQNGDAFLGVLGVMDTARPAAKAVVAALHALGVERTIMLSGDNQRVAEAVAKELGIRDARGELLPEQKVAIVGELARSGSKVAMVGDGVNDAPALAHATVGIAMGAGGSDVALETADVALMADDLAALPFAVGLSRAARRIIVQNLWASLGMVVFLVPATMFGFAGIGPAVALHEGSTLLVVVNALRLLAHPDPRARPARIEAP